MVAGGKQLAQCPEKERLELWLNVEPHRNMPPPSSTSAEAATAHSFNKVLNQYKSSSRSRTTAEVEESVKKLRRLILVDGIPSAAVRCSPHIVNLQANHYVSIRILRYDQEYGRYCYVSRIFHRICFWSTSREGLVK